MNKHTEKRGENMKKGTAVAIISLAILMPSIIMSGCLDNSHDNRLNVVVTFYPLAFLTEMIGGDNVTVTTLIPQNTEVHTWEPKTSDIVKADDAGLLIYNGAGLERWIGDLFTSINMKNKVIVDCTENVSLLDINSMNYTNNADNTDPHTWLDPVNAKEEAKAILNGLCKADPNNSTFYHERAKTVFAKLDELNNSFEENLSNKSVDEIIAAHDAYRYLGKRYGFNATGIVDISGDKQPSTSEMDKIATYMEEKNIYTLYTTPEFSDAYVQSLKNTLEEDTGHNVTILPLYTMTGEINGMNFYEMNEKNIENLKVGLV